MRLVIVAGALALSAVACSSASEESVATGASELSTCNPGWVYCGEHTRVRGELETTGRSTNDIYRCNPDRSLTLVEQCASGCEVKSTAENDSCRGAGNSGAGLDLAVFPPRAGSQVQGKNAPSSLVKDPSVEYFVLAAAPTEGGVRVYSEELRIDRQNGMCETAEKVRFTRGGVEQVIANPDLSAGSAGVRKLLRFDAAVLNAGTSAIHFGGANASGLVSKSLFSYSPCHAHDHMSGFATYRLLDANGAPVKVGSVDVTGRKQGFCIGDVIEYGSGPNPVASRVNNRCADMILSPGFADVYARQDSIHRRFLGGQWIDVTGVPAGTYSVEIEVNPAVPPDAGGQCEGGLVKCGESCRLFCEGEYGNNKGRAPLTIPATPCVPSAVNDGSSTNPTASMTDPDGTFRGRLASLAQSVASTCGAIVGSASCEVAAASGSEHLTARTQNGCTLRYHWERYGLGTAGADASSELTVEKGCVRSYFGEACSATVATSCYARPECAPGRQYFDVYKDSCGVEYKNREPSGDYVCP